ncbi:MAG TPA: MFS transporter [Caulobacteraceae bacterium]|nr:MFS transporter [Caulobacteraceae bacterium]
MDNERPATRLPLSSILSISAPNLPLSTLSVALVVYLPNYFAGNLEVDMTMVGLVWMAIRFIDIPFDVVIAMAMDRTRTRLGRYRPWLVASAPILMLAALRLFMAPVGFSAGYLLVWLLVLYLGNSMSGISLSAWSATLATRYHERSRLFSVQNAVGVVGNLAALAMVILPLGLSYAGGVEAMGWLVIALVPAAILVAALLTPERIAPELKHRFRLGDYLRTLTKPDLARLFAAQIALTLGPGWMSAIYLFYFKDVRGFSEQQSSILLLTYIVAQIPGAFLAAALARRIGKHRALMVATTGFSLGLLSVFVIPRGDLLVALPPLAWTGVMASGFGLMISAMLADVGDEVRLEQGRQRISLIYAVNGLAVKIAAALSIGITFPLLAWLGYHPAEGPANTPQALQNLQIAFLAGPFFFVLLGGACVIGWRLDARRHGEIRQALDARDAELEALGAGAWPQLAPGAAHEPAQ